MRLYVHWPFCVSRCSYCDFNTRSGAGRHMHDYMGALLAELDLWSSSLDGEGTRIDSVYLGGGTPSTLSGAEVSRLLEEVRSRFVLGEDAEITVEVNPATWRAADFAAACAGGFNRISVGVQSLHDPSLRLLGRTHDAAAAIEALRNARDAGAASVSADLIYGLPGMNPAMLLGSLGRIIAMGAQHLSLYALTLAEGSRLHRRLRGSGIGLPGEDEVADQYLAACAALEEADFGQYEISNFCISGHRSRHNLGYWTRDQYLGVGAGAHSFLAGCRFHNTRSILAYIAAMREGRTVQEGWEHLDASGEREEEIVLGLRTSLGVPEVILEAEARLDDLADLDLIRVSEGRVRLTRRGMLLSSAVICELLPA